MLTDPGAGRLPRTPPQDLPFIEFCGLPGSGKTALYRALCANLKRVSGSLVDLETALIRSLRASSSARPLSLLARIMPNGHINSVNSRVLSLYRKSSRSEAALASFAAGNPVHVAHVLSAIENCSGSPDVKVRLVRHNFKLFSAYQSAISALQDGELLVLEEGFCQHLMPGATEAGGSRGPTLTEQIAAMPRAGGVVMVRASPGTCVQRLRKRGWPGFLAGRTPAEQEAWLRSAAPVSAEIAADLEKAGFCLIEVSNEGLLGTAERELEAAIKSLLEERGLPPRP
jgi:hypothetical protein